MHPCVILETLLLFSCVLGDICEGQSTIFQPSTKWICKAGCRQPLLHFSHKLCFSTELCRFTPDLAVLPDCCSKLFEGKPCRTIHRSTSNQEPEYMHEHMFFGNFHGLHGGKYFFSFLQVGNYCISTLVHEMVRPLPCPCYRLYVSFHVGLSQIHGTLDLLPREYK